MVKLVYWLQKPAETKELEDMSSTPALERLVGVLGITEKRMENQHFMIQQSLIRDKPVGKEKIERKKISDRPDFRQWMDGYVEEKE